MPFFIFVSFPSIRITENNSSSLNYIFVKIKNIYATFLLNNEIKVCGLEKSLWVPYGSEMVKRVLSKFNSLYRCIISLIIFQTLFTIQFELFIKQIKSFQEPQNEYQLLMITIDFYVLNLTDNIDFRINLLA